MAVDGNRDDIERRARPGMAFSNSDEFLAWDATWCDRCVHDQDFRRLDKGTGCPILAVAGVRECIPAEWVDGPRDDKGYSLRDQYHCTEFRTSDGGGEPQPQPEPDGMDGLFDRPERRTRMLIQPAAQRVTAGVS